MPSFRDYYSATKASVTAGYPSAVVSVPDLYDRDLDSGNVTFTGTVPASPYKVAGVVPRANTYTGITATVGGASRTIVKDTTPSAGQIAVDSATGIWTFNAADTGGAYSITCKPLVSRIHAADLWKLFSETAATQTELDRVEAYTEFLGSEVIYVSATDGDDTANGGPGDPIASLGQAQTLITASSNTSFTIVLAPGTYAYNSMSFGSSSKSVYLVGVPGQTTITATLTTNANQAYLQSMYGVRLEVTTGAFFLSTRAIAGKGHHFEKCEFHITSSNDTPAFFLDGATADAGMVTNCRFTGTGEILLRELDLVLGNMFETTHEVKLDDVEHFVGNYVECAGFTSQYSSLDSGVDELSVRDNVFIVEGSKPAFTSMLAFTSSAIANVENIYVTGNSFRYEGTFEETASGGIVMVIQRYDWDGNLYVENNNFRGDCIFLMNSHASLDTNRDSIDQPVWLIGNNVEVVRAADDGPVDPHACVAQYARGKMFSQGNRYAFYGAASTRTDKAHCAFFTDSDVSAGTVEVVSVNDVFEGTFSASSFSADGKAAVYNRSNGTNNLNARYINPVCIVDGNQDDTFGGLGGPDVTVHGAVTGVGTPSFENAPVTGTTQFPGTVRVNDLYLGSVGNEDVRLYRSAADTLRTPDSLVVDGTTTTTSLSINFGSSSDTFETHVDADFSQHIFAAHSSGASTHRPIIDFYRSRGTEASPTIVSDGDWIGSVLFRAHDGSSYGAVAELSTEIDGTPGSGDLPTRMLFKVSPDGSASRAEAIRISNDKRLELSGGFKMTRATGSSGSISANVSIYGVTGSGARSITLPSAATMKAGGVLTIKDEAGNSAAGNITVNRAGSDTIDGATSKVISTNYGSLRLYSNGSTGWFTL